jgi:hypothetical protein
VTSSLHDVFGTNAVKATASYAAGRARPPEAPRRSL